MMAAAALMPRKPLGLKPPVAGLVQLCGLMRKMPTAMKNRMMATLRSTIALFASADSLVPMTRITVISATTATAGMLMISGMWNRCGAAVQADARYLVVG